MGMGADTATVLYPPLAHERLRAPTRGKFKGTTRGFLLRDAKEGAYKRGDRFRLVLQKSYKGR